MSNKLFDGSDDEAEELQLGTNHDYAKSYNILRKKELLQKYKDRGLDVSESEFDSDSESSDEEEVDNIKFDQEFFKTLASLKSKDPRIYDKDARFFVDVSDESDNETSKKKTSKSKPVTLKDYERKVILEHNGKFESSDEGEQYDERIDRPQSPTAVEEERRLKAEFKKVMNQEDDGEDEEFGGIFKKRSKTNAETDAEEADFAKWLAGKKADIEESAQQELEPLKKYWSSNKLTQGESFLRDYILNKGYVNTEASEIPTYDEIVGENTPLSDDEHELEKQAEFEQKYNFRFEEPDADFLKRYPRTIEQSLRRTDDKRKEKRKELKERKQVEKEDKMKELELIKEMKRKEIEEKIRKLKAVTGNDELGFRDDELEQDFDPAAHDKRMQELFNDEYYNVDEGEEKPECPSDIEELAIEDWDNYDPRKKQSGDDEDVHCEDEDFNMDCDYDPEAAKQQLQEELIENTRSRKGRNGRRNRFMEMIQTEKPAFNPEDEKTYAEYIDEYYQIDCEDFVGDQPCRFKYVETTPNDFGLTIEEILLAKNKELNQWASLKKAVQNRPEHVEKKEQRLYKLKSKNEDLKRKIFKSLYGEGSDDEQQDEEENEKPPSTENATNDHAATVEQSTPISTEGMSKSKKKRLRRKAAAAATAVSVSNDIATFLATATEPQNEEQNKDDQHSNEEKTKKRKAQSEVKSMPAKKKITAGDLEQVSNGLELKKEIVQKPIISSKNKQKHKSVAQSANNPFKKQGETHNKEQQHKSAKGNDQDGSFLHGNSFNKQKRQNNFAKKSTVGNPFKKIDKSSNEKHVTSKTAHNFKAKNKTSNPSGITDERLKAYGINPRKFHNKQKYGKKSE